MMDMRHQPSNTNDRSCSDVLWEAVQYLFGELSPEQAGAYEERLGVDVAAAEALAQAVLLTESVVRCGEQPMAATCGLPQAVAARDPRLKATGISSAASRRTLSRSLQVGLATLCASGLVLVGWYLGGGANSHPAVLTPGLASLAAETSDSDIDSTLSVWVALNDAAEPAADDSMSEGSMQDSDAGDVPDWMFAAVLASTEESDESHDADGLLRGIESLDEESL